LYEHCNYAGIAVVAGVGTYNSLPSAVSVMSNVEGLQDTQIAEIMQQNAVLACLDEQWV
jgi:short subunit dehydrogenase-like uncharacterized protein